MTQQDTNHPSQPAGATYPGWRKSMESPDGVPHYQPISAEPVADDVSAHEAIKVLREALNKIASFCPPDPTVDQLDDSPEMLIRLHNAEIGDTARQALSTTPPTSLREQYFEEAARICEDVHAEKRPKHITQTIQGRLTLYGFALHTISRLMQWWVVRQKDTSNV